MIYINKKIFFQILYFLVLKEFTLRYKGTLFGYLWTILNPLTFALIYFVAFKLIMRFEIENYGIILLTAMFPWFWINTSMVQGTTSFRQNSSLIKKIKFNYMTMPLSNILHDAIHFFFSLPIIFFFIYYSDMSFHLSWLWQIPLLFIVQILFLFPIVLVLSVLNVFIKDAEYIVSLLLTMIFFLTPIIYLESMVPESYQIFVQFNPFNILISNWRSLFVDGAINYQELFLFLFFITFLAFIARKIYLKYKIYFSEYL